MGTRVLPGFEPLTPRPTQAATLHDGAYAINGNNGRHGEAFDIRTTGTTPVAVTAGRSRFKVTPKAHAAGVALCTVQAWEPIYVKGDWYEYSGDIICEDDVGALISETCGYFKKPNPVAEGCTSKTKYDTYYASSQLEVECFVNEEDGSWTWGWQNNDGFESSTVVKPPPWYKCKH